MSANKLLLLLSLFGYGATLNCALCKAGFGVAEGRPAKRLLFNDSDHCDATIKILESAFATLPPLHVKYDLYVRTETQDRKVLSVEEALSRERFFNRIVHWYDQTLYQFTDEKWDPFLNSYYWMPEKEVLLQETRRNCTVSKPTPLKSVRPRIQGYLGFCGVLVPKRREFLAGGNLPPAEGSEKLSLPQDMVVSMQPDQETVYRVNYLSTSPPVRLFTPPLKPGTRVLRENSAESYTVPGGINFLNFTIARMRRAGQHADTPTTRIGVAGGWLGCALIVIGAVTLLGHLRRPFRHE